MAVSNGRFQYPEKDWAVGKMRTRRFVMEERKSGLPFEGKMRGEQGGGGPPMLGKSLGKPTAAPPASGVKPSEISKYEPDVKYTSRQSSELKTIDWMELQNKYVPKSYLTQADPSTQQRARGQGYNPEYPIYKGGWRSDPYERPLPDPSKKSSERGLFFSEDPEVARWYAASGRAAEFVARPKNPAMIDFKGRVYDHNTMDKVVEDARRAGHDAVVIRNVVDVGGTPEGIQTQIVITDPKLVRAPTAKFDPESMHLGDLLSSIVAGAAVSGAAVKTLSPGKEE